MWEGLSGYIRAVLAQKRVQLSLEGRWETDVRVQLGSGHEFEQKETMSRHQ